MVLSNRQLLVWVLSVWNREFDWNIIQDNQTTLTFRTNNHCNRRPNTKTKKKVAFTSTSKEYIYCRSMSNTCIHTDITLHYITLHIITYHYITIHDIKFTLRCITLHYTLHITCYILHVTYYTLHVRYYMLDITYSILHITLRTCVQTLAVARGSNTPSAQAQSCGVIPLGPTVTAGQTLGGEVLHRLICVYVYIYICVYT